MREDKKIDKLIRESLKAQQPSADFTNKVMNKISAFEESEDKALASLLHKHAMQSPSLNFTSRVMNAIQKESVIVKNEPIIGKKAWIFIAISTLALIVYSLLLGHESNMASSVINQGMSKVEAMFAFDLPGILGSPIFALSVFALSTLLFLDYFMGNRRMSLKV